MSQKAKYISVYVHTTVDAKPRCYLRLDLRTVRSVTLELTDLTDVDVLQK